MPDRIEPADIIEIALELPISARTDLGHAYALVVARLCGQPVGMVLVDAATAADADALAQALDHELRELVIAQHEAHGLPKTITITQAGLGHADCPVRAARARAAGSGPPISVLLCTRERPDDLRRCLESLLLLEYGDYEVIVVDNAPKTARTKDVCEELSSPARSGGRALHYLIEPRPGLSHARNRALAQARHEIVAFIDDDERADAGWLSGLAEAFTRDPQLGAVSGLVLPAELETRAQAQFEQFGGHSKGRGFCPAIFDAEYLRTVQSALYPLPPFGVGANMAFRRTAISAIGGFDPLLGAGTPLRGGEDTYAFSELLLAGWRMAYSPGAVTWHYHRREAEALTSQLSGYGLGLGAYYVALLWRAPGRIFALIALLPRAVHDIRDPQSVRNASSGNAPGGPPGLPVPDIVRGALRYARLRFIRALKGRRGHRARDELSQRS
ncbi:MAG TPA: glycosyltransferase family 2 protein [Solirubrobacteraceae bacterium]|nr:glycosyltransferase family 2 protein [Solirubrobacteraceae bacterium]